MEPMVDFYVGLGFTITDRMDKGFTWLRSNVEHHSIAIVDTGRSGGLDHYSWDLAEWEDFKTWADRLTDLGVTVQWGPGRHGPGGNLFVFYDDLDGNHIELSRRNGTVLRRPRPLRAAHLGCRTRHRQPLGRPGSTLAHSVKEFPMRFASCLHAGRPFAAAILDDLAVPLEGIDELGTATPTTVLQEPPLRHADAVPLAEVTLRPVVPRPGKIICVGLNYLSHVGETGRDTPEYPVLFTKFAESLVGPTDPIMAPPESVQLDWEAELAVVIGRPGRRITPDSALEHVAGYTIANDITMRDYQYKTQPVAAR